MKIRSSKIKITKIEYQSFPADKIVIDSYWNDLIENGDRSYIEQKRKKQNEIRFNF